MGKAQIDYEPRKCGCCVHNKVCHLWRMLVKEDSMPMYFGSFDQMSEFIAAACFQFKRVGK